MCFRTRSQHCSPANHHPHVPLLQEANGRPQSQIKAEGPGRETLQTAGLVSCQYQGSFLPALEPNQTFQWGIFHARVSILGREPRHRELEVCTVPRPGQNPTKDSLYWAEKDQTLLKWRVWGQSQGTVRWHIYVAAASLGSVPVSHTVP